MLLGITDYSLELLLDLDGFIAEVGGGYWVKIEVQAILVNPRKPHGIDYSLTLHSPDGERLLGYDNAHPVRERRGPTKKENNTNDHTHRKKTIRRYKYVDAEKLINDFWTDVDRVLKEHGVSK